MYICRFQSESCLISSRSQMTATCLVSKWTQDLQLPTSKARRFHVMVLSRVICARHLATSLLYLHYTCRAYMMGR